jgi:hypothetical protein
MTNWELEVELKKQFQQHRLGSSRFLRRGECQESYEEHPESWRALGSKKGRRRHPKSRPLEEMGQKLCKAQSE